MSPGEAKRTNRSQCHAWLLAVQTCTEYPSNPDSRKKNLKKNPIGAFSPPSSAQQKPPEPLSCPFRADADTAAYAGRAGGCTVLLTAFAGITPAGRQHPAPRPGKAAGGCPCQWPKPSFNTSPTQRLLQRSPDGSPGSRERPLP